MTNVALTTIFTPPPSCFDNSYTLPAAGGSIYVKDISITSYECYPSGFQPLFAAGVPYSPGVCPSGYTYEQTSSYRDDATAVLCCPKYVMSRLLGSSSILLICCQSMDNFLCGTRMQPRSYQADAARPSDKVRYRDGGSTCNAWRIRGLGVERPVAVHTGLRAAPIKPSLIHHSKADIFISCNTNNVEHGAVIKLSSTSIHN